MKLKTIKSQSCDRIECTYNHYYVGSSLELVPVSEMTETIIIRFLSDIVISGGITAKEFSRIYQIINNVMKYVRDMDIGGARLLDWERIRCYMPDGNIVTTGNQYYAVPRSNVVKMLDLVVHRSIYPRKMSACLCLMLNFFLGLRIGELASLAWQDIDIGNQSVRIYKNQIKRYQRDETGRRLGSMSYEVVEDLKTPCSFREIPLLPEAIYIINKLWLYHETCGYNSPYLAYDGTDCILVRSLDRTLRRLCRLCSVTRFSSHSIRKTFATMLHASGMPTRYISDLLGHSDMRVTERNYILTYQNHKTEYLEYMKNGLSFRLDGS